MTISSVTSGSVAAGTSGGARGLAQAAPVTPGLSAQKTVVAEATTQAPTSAHIAQATKRVNDAFVKIGQNLQAVIEKDKATGIDVVKIQDKNTKEVISQFPPKEIVAMAEAISQSLAKKGQMLNVSA